MTGLFASLAGSQRAPWLVVLPWLLTGLAMLVWLSPGRVLAADVCTVEIDGRSLAAADDPARAIPVPAESVVVVVCKTGTMGPLSEYQVPRNPARGTTFSQPKKVCGISNWWNESKRPSE